MNIALVVHDLHERGGHGLYTKVLADELSRRHEVAVFANRCDAQEGARWVSRHVPAWRGSALATVRTFPLGLRSRAKALGRYEIRHAQGFCGGGPNVVTAHICVAAYLDSLRGAALRHRLSLRAMAAAEERFYRRFGGRVIAVSRLVARGLRDFYGVCAPVAVIPHGVDSKRFGGANRARLREETRRRLGVNEDETVALYVGDLTKAHAYLKELARAAPSARLLIVTASRAYHWDAGNVRIMPPTAELERFYAAADAFVFPTTYDAFGMVLLEAMASGLPVFTSERAGAAELITDGEDGFVTTLDGWVETTAARLEDRATLEAVGRAAERTARRHDWPSVVNAVERLYTEVAAA